MNVPNSTSEAEEAQWWLDHQEELASEFQAAAQRGERSKPGEGRVARFLRERVAMRISKNSIALDLAPRDLESARDFAAKRGLLCEKLLRDLIHEGLNAELQREE